MKEKLYFVLSMIIFGAVGVFVKYISIPSSEIAFFLSLIGTIFLLTIVLVRKQTVSWEIVKQNAGVLFLAGLALNGNWIFLFQSYRETTIANAALSYYFAPVLVMLLSPLVLKEKWSLKKLFCIAVALLGLCLILQSSTQEITGNHLLGVCYGLAAASFYATLTLTNKFIRGLDGLTMTLMQLGIAVVLLFPFVFATAGFASSARTRETILLMLLLGVLHGGVGFYLFFAGMKGIKAQSIAVLSYIDPLTSLVISALILREKMTFLQLLGSILLLGSIWVSETSAEKIEKAT